MAHVLGPNFLLAARPDGAQPPRGSERMPRGRRRPLPAGARRPAARRARLWRVASSYVVVWLLFVFAWTANFAIRVGFSALLPPIIRDLDLSYARAGVLASAFFWAYLALQIPSGLLGDRFGRRRVLIVGLIAVAVATAATGLAGSLAALVVARLATGAGQGSLFANDRAIIASVTPREKIGLGQGVSFTGPGLGITVGLMLGGEIGRASCRERGQISVG